MLVTKRSESRSIRTRSRTKRASSAPSDDSERALDALEQKAVPTEAAQPIRLGTRYAVVDVRPALYMSAGVDGSYSFQICQ